MSFRSWLFTGSLALVCSLNIAGCPTPAGDGNPDPGNSNGSGSNTNNNSGGSGNNNSGGGNNNNGGLNARITPAVPTLFVADKNGGILSFRDPATLDGNVAPDTRISGNFILLEGAAALGVDRAGDLLALSADRGIAVFTDADSATGDLQPDRRLTGDKTGLTHVFTLNSALLYDAAADRVFACNSSAVLVWDRFSTRAVQGNLAPDRTITSPDATSPNSLALGPNGDLYVTARTHVAVFRNGAARNGEIAADRIIDVLDDTSVFPGVTITVDTIFIDRADRLYLFDTDPGAIISVVDNASTRDGIIPADRTIDIDLPPNSPGSIAPDFFPGAIVIDSNGVGYVSDFGQDAIHIIPDIGTKDGLLPVGQMISGSNTRFDEIGGLFIWE